MKYLLLLFAPILFSQHIKSDTLFIYNTNSLKIEKKLLCNERIIHIGKQTHFDSLILTLKKRNNNLKSNVKKENTFLMNEFLEMNFVELLNFMSKNTVFIIDRKKYYEIKDYVLQDRVQE